MEFRHLATRTRKDNCTRQALHALGFGFWVLGLGFRGLGFRV